MRKIGTCRKRMAAMLAAAIVLSQMPVSSIAAPHKIEHTFNDVKDNAWYTDAIMKWTQNGIVTGYKDGSFKPNRQVTRGELAVIIDRIFALKDIENAKKYEDVAEGKWYEGAISRISAMGLMNDYNGKFEPNKMATREELAYALANIYKLEVSGDQVVLDEKEVSDWAKDAVNALSTAGYMKGMPNGKFAPKAFLTRAELMVVIDRLNAEIIKEAGTYTKEIQGNVVISGKDVVLKDITVTGNVYISGNAESITLENAIVKGNIFIDENVTLDLKGKSNITSVVISAYNPSKDKVATIKMTKEVVISQIVADELVQIKGQGKIETLYENKTGIKSEVKPDKVITANGITSAFKVTTGGGGSTSSSKLNSSKPSKPEDQPSQDESAIKWKLVWSDEFDGDAVDTTKWGYNNGFLDVNQEKQVYKAENATVKDGKLKITAKKEETVIDGKTYDYTSARMVTKGKYAQKYGKIEVRAKLPLGKSLWPAIWMLPENEEYTGWPTSGEIDIMESRGSVNNEVWGTLHYGDKRPDNKQSGSSYVLPEGQTIDDFHTYAIEWQPGEIRWYVDGVLYQTQDNWYAIDSETGERYAFPAPFDKEFHLLLNLAVGGWYDGVGPNLDADDSIFDGGKEYAMEVDYVRMYESETGQYPEAIDPNSKRPELPEGSRMPLADGNLIYDNTYAKYGIKDNKEAEEDFGEGWNLLYLTNYEGGATAKVEEIDGKPFAKISIDQPGNQTYSVQMVQLTTLGRNRTYKLSFDAKAEGERDIKFKVGGGESRSYAVYSGDYTESLNTDVKHIEKVFTMRGLTDTQARCEFNVGLDDKDVWIGNVKLEEITNPEVEDFNKPKAPLKNGSLIYNGTFDKGGLDRLTYWNLEMQNGAAATMHVPEATRDLHIYINKGGSDLRDVNFNQQGLSFSEDANYTVVFAASADKMQPMKVKLVGEDGQTVYAEEDVLITENMQNYELVMHCQGKSTNKGRLLFEMGGIDENEVVFDNMSVIETRQDFDNVEIFPLKNGDFSNGGANWDGLYIEGGKGKVTFDGEAKFTTTDLGANPWSVMLQQKDMPFSAGVKYIIEFEASSDIPRDMTVKIEEEGTWRAFFEKNVRLTPEKQKYSFEYTMPADGDKTLGLKFLFGNMTGAPTDVHSVTIDNVVCEVKDGLILKSQLKNGQFDKNLDGWNAYVAENAKADFSVEDKMLKLKSNELGANSWEVQLAQKGVKLEQGKTYQVGFKARSEEATKLKVTVGHENEDYSYKTYLAQDEAFEISNEMKAYTFKFTMNDKADENVKFALEAGAQEGAVPTTIYLDDLYMTEVSSGEDNQEEEKTENLLINGDFKNGNKNWNVFSAGSAMAEFNYDQGAKVDIKAAGEEPWQISFEQAHVKLEQGKTYCLALDANATTASSLRVSFQDSTYAEYAGDYSPLVTLKEGDNQYTYEFTVNKEVGSDLTFKIQMGYDKDSSTYWAGENQIIIHRVVLTKKAEEE